MHLNVFQYLEQPERVERIKYLYLISSSIAGYSKNWNTIRCIYIWIYVFTLFRLPYFSYLLRYFNVAQRLFLLGRVLQPK